MTDFKNSAKLVHDFEKIQSAKDAIFAQFEMQPSEPPRIGIVLGSGLGGFAQQIRPLGKMKTLPYEAIPHFPTSSIEGHRGEMHFGHVNGCRVVAMQGRVHQYEGYAACEVVFPVRVLAALGIKTLILTNAAGAINTAFRAGDLMLINDHINMTGDNPLVGPNDPRLGSRFTDMTNAYSLRLRDLTKLTAKEQGLNLREGCYFGVLGPSYETPAEIRMMRTCGADAVGMSTVFEAITARHSGVEVLGVSCLTNMAAGIEEKALDHLDVTSTAKDAENKFTRLLSAVIPKIDPAS